MLILFYLFIRLNIIFLYYSIIVSPKTNKSVSIYSSLGKNILKKYLKALIGGSGLNEKTALSGNLKTTTPGNLLMYGEFLELSGQEELSREKYNEALKTEAGRRLAAKKLTKKSKQSELLRKVMEERENAEMEEIEEEEDTDEEGLEYELNNEEDTDEEGLEYDLNNEEDEEGILNNQNIIQKEDISNKIIKHKTE